MEIPPNNRARFFANFLLTYFYFSLDFMEFEDRKKTCNIVFLLLYILIKYPLKDGRVTVKTY